MKPIQLKQETKKILYLLAPMTIAGFVDASPGFINNIMLAHLGASKLAAGALVSMLFSTLVMLFYGVFATVSTLVAHHYGASNRSQIAAIVRDAMIIALIISLPVMWFVWNAADVLPYLGQKADTIPLARSYLHGLTFSVIPDFTTIILWQFFLGIGRPRVTLVGSLLYVPINILANYSLIFGKFGLPRLEMMGVGLGNTIGFTVVLIGLLLYMVYSNQYRAYFKLDYLKEKQQYFKELFHLGLPTGFMWLIELLFGCVLAIFMGKVSLATLAAHQIAMQTLIFAFVVISCTAQAVTVRMGHCIGSRQTAGLSSICVSGVLVITFYTLCTDIIYLFFPHFIIGLDFNLADPKNQEIIGLAVKFLAALAFVQLFDGMRFTLFGALRGMKDTTFSFLVSVLVFFGLAVPSGYIAVFILHRPALDFWICLGFSVAVGAFLLACRCSVMIKRVMLRTPALANS